MAFDFSGFLRGKQAGKSEPIDDLISSKLCYLIDTNESFKTLE